ncbi:DUF3267 domain-containing protein [Oceanobacillus timonensis]|uniref:DUF3267 domain-containing protein n=1 Tax=Oceanobacillus timonensis TaxID=1926285 RepID=UPI0009BC250C|nr:DUF3267 domain-containing protein [Oceanobacillus timonensis]
MNILKEKKIVIWLNIWSLIIFILVFTLGIFILPAGAAEITILNLILFLVSMFVLFCFHELIHGTFFKLFAPGSKVKYGMKSGMLYAANPGNTYGKLPFIVICIMPFIIITCLLTIASLFPINAYALYLLFAVHTAGCVGDFYFIGLLNKPSLKIKTLS